MPKLSVLDLAMFALETRERPINIGPLVVLAPPAGAPADFAGKLLARMLKRPVGAPFNLCLRQPLLGLPRLEEVEVDPRTHVHRLSLDPPGTLAQLFELVCELHETLIERSRPPWEFYLIEGLANGRLALYGKVHHGIIDGRSFVQAASNWLATSARDRSVHALWEGVPQAQRTERAPASLGDRARQAAEQAAGAAGSALALARMLARQGAGAMGVGIDDAMVLPYRGVPPVLTGPDSHKRVFAYCTLPLARLKALSRDTGATINDLLLTTLDLGVEAYLRAQGETLEQPLVAAIPVALSKASGGNQIAVLQCPLGTPGERGTERLAEIQGQTARIKAAVREDSSDTVMLYTSLVHGLPAALRKVGVDHTLTVSNFIFSNPYGFAEKRYLMGAEIELALPISTVTPGQMLNVTAVTLAGDLQLGFLGIPAAVPRIGRLAAATVTAFEKLAAALTRSTSPRAKRKRRTPPKQRG